MTDHKITPTVEMYLITIFVMASENHQEHVSISSLAEKLHVQPVSANQMVRKMADEGWVEYLPYKGVQLTDSGRDHALRVLRLRQLWEVFLVRELHIPLDEAEVLACDLEHHISEKVAERLDDFLSHPELCFHGEPIPRKFTENSGYLISFPLTELAVGASAPVIRIKEGETTQKFLIMEGLRPGVSVKLAALGSGGDCLIESGGKRIHLSEEVASSVILGKGDLE